MEGVEHLSLRIRQEEAGKGLRRCNMVVLNSLPSFCFYTHSLSAQKSKGRSDAVVLREVGVQAFIAGDDMGDEGILS